MIHLKYFIWSSGAIKRCRRMLDKRQKFALLLKVAPIELQVEEIRKLYNISEGIIEEGWYRKLV